MRSKAAWLTAVAAVLVAGLAVPVSVAGAKGAGGVDADRDKIFDSLDRALARAQGGDRLGVVAVFAGGSSGARAAEAKSAVGAFDVTYEYRTMSAFAAEMTADQVRALARRPDVVHVQENSHVELAVDTAKASVGADRAAVDFGVDGNNELSATCPGEKQYYKDDLVIAVLDSGFDTGHADLDIGKVIGGTDC
ncbi:MAG TPA: protease inhibitor I9 family protein, partial [Actinomycetota bacterium]|nr:protease inhibitor I9 family protein [Actinomycetota bacterium]